MTTPTDSTDSTDSPIDPFGTSRAKLHGIAYRMTGSVADADDIVQEVWLRWRRADHAAITGPEAWLVRVTSNAAIDRARAASRRRIDYVGPSLPEPLPWARPDDDPADAAALGDSLTFAFLVMLDALDPVERAVVLLHDVFGFTFDEVGALTDRSAAAARQSASRARRKLRGRNPQHVTTVAPRATLERLVTALAAGDPTGVVAVLSPDVVLLSDGGPHRHAARRPVTGADRCSRLLLGLARRTSPSTTLDWATFNGGDALFARTDGRPDYVITADITADGDGDGRIDRIFIQLNPAKLGHLS
jgi:RNA polymerase sigma-70 factor (ECF subfamily)